MTYDEQTAVRLVRVIVNDGTSVYCPPLRREVLRRLVAAHDELERENAVLRQRIDAAGKRESVHL